jgi:hypothetical protein
MRKDENKVYVKAKFLIGLSVPAPGTYKFFRQRAFRKPLAPAAGYVTFTRRLNMKAQVQNMKAQAGNIVTLPSCNAARISQIGYMAPLYSMLLDE